MSHLTATATAGSCQVRTKTVMPTITAYFSATKRHKKPIRIWTDILTYKELSAIINRRSRSTRSSRRLNSSKLPLLAIKALSPLTQKAEEERQRRLGRMRIGGFGLPSDEVYKRAAATMRKMR
jgi:hypothetical protein